MYRTSILRRTQERFDRATLVHGPIALGDAIEGQHEVEHFPGLIFPAKTSSIKCGRYRRTGAGPPEQTNVTEEEVRAVERETVRHADVADRPPQAASI